MHLLCFLQYVHDGRIFSFKLEKSEKTKRVRQRGRLQNNNEETRKSETEGRTREKIKNAEYEGGMPSCIAETKTRGKWRNKLPTLSFTHPFKSQQLPKTEGRLPTACH